MDSILKGFLWFITTHLFFPQDDTVIIKYGTILPIT